MKRHYNYYLFGMLVVGCLWSAKVLGAGCSSGGCGQKGHNSQLALPQLTIGHARVSVSQENTSTGGHGSLFRWDGDTYVESDLKGDWFRVNDTPGWTVDGPTYTGEYGDYTKVSFSIHDVLGGQYYFYEKEGSWTSEYEIAEDTCGAIPLIKMSYSASGTTAHVAYTQDAYGRVIEQATSNGYIKYSYVDPDDGDTPLNRIWAGANPCDFAARTELEEEPTGGRWIDLDYDSVTHQLEHIKHGCGSCGGGERWIDYVPTTTNPIFDTSINPNYDPDYIFDPNNTYDPQQDPNNYRPGGYLISKIRAADPCDVLVSYEYDNLDRMVKQWLGDVNTGQLVTEHIYLNHHFEDTQQTGIKTHIEKHYIDGSYYRAMVYLAKGKGVSEERYYLDLQTATYPIGDYAPYFYHSEAITGGWKTTATLPKGNKIHHYFTDYSGMTKREREDFSGTVITEAEYDYWKKYYDDGFQTLLREYTDAYGGLRETQYYANTQVHKEIASEVTPVKPGCCFLDPGDPDYCGASDPRCTQTHQQVTEYAYNSRCQLTEEQRKDANGDAVITKYAYDDFGNMKLRIEAYDLINCSDPNDPNTCLNATKYTYNEYNEPETVTNPQGVKSKTYYSNSGAVLAEAVFDGGSATHLASATMYRYNTNGWLIRKSVANETESFPETDLLADIANPETPELNWIHEDYEYDDYGRRDAIVIDAGGKSLRTEFAYNHQSEIYKTTYPDGHFQELIRDGRGQVIYEILGKSQEDIAVMEYHYDLNGNLDKKTLPEGETEHFIYDGFDRLISTRRGG
ncbi:MAG: hypothetical protein JW709_08635 [Sedimentisphaerales bacterium]|nr:hypothetical protein [Sedimentisphaerales bacterium]